MLERILREPHFSLYADSEAGWLAEQILPIAASDPSFAAEIYASLFGQSITDTSTTDFGGQRSRIMPLSSNRRQDYEHSRWHLEQSIEEFLSIAPEEGTRAVIDALVGEGKTAGYPERHEPCVIDLGSTTIEFCGDSAEFDAWDEAEDQAATTSAGLLSSYVAFLRNCDVEAFASSVAAASRDYATASVWARILGVASERAAEVGDLIWPAMTRFDLLEEEGTLRDAVRFVAAAWPSRSHAQRERFESMVLERVEAGDDDAEDTRRHILGRLLALVPEAALSLEATRELRRQMDASNELTENRPIRTTFASWGGRQSLVRDELCEAGVDVDSGSTRDVLEASDGLEERVGATPTTSDAAELAALWAEAMALLELIDADPDLHAQVHHAAWGNLSNAVQRVASSPNFAPATYGLPSLDSLFVVLDRLSASPYPEPSDGSG